MTADSLRQLAADLTYDPAENLLLAAENFAPAGPITTFTVGGGALVWRTKGRSYS